MKYLIGLLTFLATMSAYSQTNDKMLHFTASLAISQNLYKIIENKYNSTSAALVTSAAATLMIGHIKESTDAFYDTGDMTFNILGVGTGLLITRTWDW